mmetsp:Transcript_10526/g.14199  ORF Transcript_10526/g.14199 Transcript_10526/m.14199 type:complete len:94 (-) Transcript_10526:134-415(-)
MGLKRPLKLTQIITAGKRIGTPSLARIQFKFEDGVESPVINSNNQNTMPAETYDLKGKKIASIIARVYNNSWITQLKVKYEGHREEGISKIYS